MLHAAVRCHQGKVRTRNEDSVLDCPSLGLWAVADGVGGNGHGDVASQMAVQALERKVRQGSSLRQAVAEADRVLRDAVSQQEDLKGMATTIVACKVDGDHFEVAWVGDSRAYLLDATGIHRITQDHNVAGELLAKGHITRAQFDQHPGQHELTQAIGLMRLDEIPHSVGEFHEGDRLLLCTDGLSGVVTDDVLCDLAAESPVEHCADSLLQAALDGGAPDNIALAVLSWQPEADLIQAHDFQQSGFRLPFDRRPYNAHCKQRPWFFVLFLLGVFAMLWLI